jgi:hypothetical protein
MITCIRIDEKNIRAYSQLDTNFHAVTKKNTSGCLQQTSNRIVQLVTDHIIILKNSQLTTIQIANQYGPTPSR